MIEMNYDEFILKICRISDYLEDFCFGISATPHVDDC
jgi:hypothetical protein